MPSALLAIGLCGPRVPSGGIGRGACRGRGEISGGAGSLKKKKKEVRGEGIGWQNKVAAGDVLDRRGGGDGGSGRIVELQAIDLGYVGARVTRCSWGCESGT